MCAQVYVCIKVITCIFRHTSGWRDGNVGMLVPSIQGKYLANFATLRTNPAEFGHTSTPFSPCTTIGWTIGWIAIRFMSRVARGKSNMELREAGTLNAKSELKWADVQWNPQNPKLRKKKHVTKDGQRKVQGKQLERNTKRRTNQKTVRKKLGTQGTHEDWGTGTGAQETHWTEQGGPANYQLM